MMRNQACEPCAKRKVRCDRADPSCSNCKRRKQDRCVYLDPSSDARIKRLEEIIRSLGGEALLNGLSDTPDEAESGTSTGNKVANTSSVERDVDRSIYLESQGWLSWVNVTRGRRDVISQLGPEATVHRPAKGLPHAFSGSPMSLQTQQSSTLADSFRATPEAAKLWMMFRERVDPVARLSFSWTLERLQSAVSDQSLYKKLTAGERALIVASCYFGVVSLTKDECLAECGISKPDMLTAYRYHCEQSLIHINILTISDMESLKALCLYVKASVDMVSSQSLWSLMGLVCRSAELLGIHRDGELLGLGAVETEERRRLWWQIQHIDLIMAVKNGSTPLTFTCDWDSRLPLNIEDEEISLDDTILKEKPGMTTFSYTLFTCWIMYQQRRFRLVHRQEAGLQTQFLQYCDPSAPIDTLLQVSARAVLCALRLRRMHETRMTCKEMETAFHNKYLDLCMKVLGYTIMTFTQPSLKSFHWMGEVSMMWHALITLLVDMPQMTDEGRIKAAWALLADLYEAAAFLKDFALDQRRLRAAELVLAAWKACASKPVVNGMQKPALITELETIVSQATATDDTHPDLQISEHVADGTQTDQTFSELLALDFVDIEWSYWQ
ncbi:hypothetical protein LMH87_004937 [Akanthomyces muscarius]|uniref:Zn(2)-C6 fungal-type domain-containing protein n=1 Tax=Akanthomyces muscarius TaxID=2231603 RepID=A0A9W8URG0_AKAMU|nr:hypothetical protein LMH87_004937 [Akanthomyces muscarius]KAJ4163193.1 hypothetical protein LMH87_004937 [Akanthomyces muscarius]